MLIWDAVLGSATELDLLRLGEALQVGSQPRTAMGVLQALLRENPRRGLKDILAHFSDDTLRLASSRAGLSALATSAQIRSAMLELEGAGGEVEWLSLEVPRRKPRLAWQGIHTRSAVTSVPTQVMEVVSPGLAEYREGSQVELEGIRVNKTRREARAPVGRLIWTNDNLVALQTLLDERDPVTKDMRYRGKVDLIYIDPPFMVNDDFVADNSITIDVDGEEGVSATKELHYQQSEVISALHIMTAVTRCVPAQDQTSFFL